MGDSHTRRINKNLFNNSINECKTHFSSFSGASINRLDHFITPTVEEDQPDIVIIYVGSNDITDNSMNNLDVKGISKRIIDIGKKCLLQYLSKEFKLRRIIRQVNDHRRDECRSTKFHFISNDNITNEYLWKDGLLLNNESTYIFASILVDSLNFIFNRNVCFFEKQHFLKQR